MIEDIDITNIHNESDVEQKLMLPLLTSASPTGLSYKNSDFRTKPDIRGLTIAKRKNQKIFYPDYIIVLEGLPLVVIETKNPSDDINEAYREARMYALELNSTFPSEVNPCQKIIVSNGHLTVAGKWDSDDPEVSVSIENMNPSNIDFSNFIKFVEKNSITKLKTSILSKIKGKREYKKPTNLLGGSNVQNEELHINSFGATLSIDYKHIYNPETPEQRKNIVLNAYVESKKKIAHVGPIEKIIRAALPPSLLDSKKIENTNDPKGILNTFRTKDLKHELLLLIGSVGSGKSTFTDYLKDVILPEDIKEKTVWSTINLNNAPLSKEQIYDWLRVEISNDLKDKHNDIDFDELDVLYRVYAVEVEKLKKGRAKLFQKDSSEYNKLFSDLIGKLQSDIDKTLNCLVRYLCAEREKTLIVVLDNIDKRTSEDQLLMFEVANWLKKNTYCMVFLPLRDTTYDHYRKMPPLDTVVKDMVYRIDPPLLSEVLSQRIKYALHLMNKKTNKTLSYHLPNGITVKYPQSDQGFYLVSILNSLFNNTFFTRLMAGLAGRDIRKGLEIFLDFCKSNHIEESEILKITQSKGKYSLPNHIISRVLIRGNRKYYNDSKSRLKNLFDSNVNDVVPNPFTRVAILNWLKYNHRVHGPNNTLGYHKLENIITVLNSLGFSDNRVRLEVNKLVSSECIYTETHEIHNVEDNELISISPSGIIHLDLISNVDYLSACSEDVWYRDERLAEGIAERLKSKTNNGQINKTTLTNNALDLINYLNSYKLDIFSQPESFLKKNSYPDLINLNSSIASIRKIIKTDKDYINVEKIELDYPKGHVIESQIGNIVDYGIFVEFGLYTGFVHKKHINSPFDIKDLEAGQFINVEIVKFNLEHGRFEVVIVE